MNIRRKDRLTYAHQAFIVDLTQVTPSSQGGAPAQQTHELEVEFRDPNELMRLAQLRGGTKPASEEGERFNELVWIFINNVRILAKNA